MVAVAWVECLDDNNKGSVRYWSSHKHSGDNALAEERLNTRQAGEPLPSPQAAGITMFNGGFDGERTSGEFYAGS